MKTGRNAPCPCGSGKKYKACCLKLDQANRKTAGETSIQQVAARARTWQADLLPFPARIDDDPAARPAAMLVTAEGFLIFTEILPCPSAEVEDIAAELARAVLAAAEKIGALPAEIVVREPEVAAILAERIRQAGSQVAVGAGRLTELEAAMAALNQNMVGIPAALAPSIPATWAAWGQPGDWVAEVFRRSAAYHRARPWRYFDDFPLIIAEMPEGGSWYLSIMGSGAVEYGLAFYSDPDDLDLMIDDATASPNGRILSLTFDDGKLLQRAMRREIARAGWEVASADAYPVLLTIGTPAGGLRRTDARDLLAVLAAVTAWIEAIDGDRGIIDRGPWRDPRTGVELEADGLPVSETPDFPPIPLEPGDAEGPGARPEAALDRPPFLERKPKPVDGEWLKRFSEALEAKGLSEKTVRVHADNAGLFLEYLANWISVPVAAVHELDLRSFLFDWYPRKADASKSDASRVPASLRYFFDFLYRHDGISCPWAAGILKDKQSFLARWDASSGGAWWDEDVVDWRAYHFDELDRRALSPSTVVPGVLIWGPTQGLVEAALYDELERHWVFWRDQLIRSGVQQSDEVRLELQQREAEWLTTPHKRYQDRTPAAAIDAERDESAERRK